MKKYYLIAKNTWDEILTYRLNFIVWRIRNVFQLITTYFFWNAVVPTSTSFAGYNHALIITYVLGANYINSLVFSSKSGGIGGEINDGNLSNFLVRPINYFFYWASRDTGDKLMNILFATGEFIIFYLLFHPTIFFQSNSFILFSTIMALFFAIVLAFLFNFLLGFIAFWSPEVWAPRFIFTIIIGFFAGGFFPLSILPKFWYILIMATPLPYMQYFPMQLYVGKIGGLELIIEMLVSIFWVVALWKIVQFLWRRGLIQYSAQGR